jgi:hypothetical protein
MKEGQDKNTGRHARSKKQEKQFKRPDHWDVLKDSWEFTSHDPH